MRDNELWEKYKGKDVVWHPYGGKKSVVGIIVAVRYGGSLVFEATDGWCHGHDGNRFEIAYGSVPRDLSKKRYWIDSDDVEIIEDFVRV